MKTPKILPWLARKAGISDARAETLWHRALRHATQKAGWVNSSEYWHLAEEEWLRLLEAEHQASCRPQIVPMARAQRQLGEMPLLAWEGMMRAANQAWQQVCGRYCH